MKAKLLTRPKKTKARTPPRSDLTPLLNGLAIEIEETMDLLFLARSDNLGKEKIDILCNKVGASLLRMQDIRDSIRAAVED